MNIQSCKREYPLLPVPIMILVVLCRSSQTAKLGIHNPIFSQYKRHLLFFLIKNSYPAILSRQFYSEDMARVDCSMAMLGSTQRQPVKHEQMTQQYQNKRNS